MILSAIQTVLGIFALSFVYILAVVIYRLTLHPLAKYPGPLLAKITEWYNTYHAWKGDRHLDQWRCHEIYGPVVRYAPNHVIINTVGALHDIYAGSKNNNVQKAPMYKLLHIGGTSTHSEINKAAHGRKRRVLGHAFSDQALKSMEVFITDNVDRWCKLLGEDNAEAASTWSKSKDMAKWANYVTFDVLGELCFGKSFNMMDSTTNRGVPSMMLSRTQNFQVVGNSPLLPYWHQITNFGLDKVINAKSSKDIEQFTEFAKQAMNERVKQSKGEKDPSEESMRKDFFFWLTRAKDPLTGQGYSLPEMWAESKLLITAGSDTSSITMAAAFFYLTRRPKILAKLQHELRTTFSDVQEIYSGPHLNSCHYLRAVIDETLRMCPPVASDLPREVMAGGMEIDGQHYPAGAIVGTSAYAIHHSEECFADPFIFRPERWIVNSEQGVSAESVAAARAAFCPFSLGSRGCIGKPMAYAELSIALGRVFYLYDVKLKEGDTTGAGNPQEEWGRRRKDEYQIRDIFVGDREGPLVEFKPHQAIMA